MIINKNIKILFVTCLAVLVAGLLLNEFSRKLPTSPNTTNKADISATVKMPNKQLASILTSMTLTVTNAADNAVLKTVNLVLDGTKAQDTLSVPSGKLLYFTASAYEGATLVLQGIDSLKAKSGEKRSLAIKMQFKVPAVILTPTEKTVNVGDSLSVYVNARSVVNLTTMGVQVVFDTTRLAVVTSNLEKNFMEKNGGAMKQLVLQEGSIPGTFNTIVSVFPATDAVSDSGRVARILFRAKTAGHTDLAISLDHTLNPDLGLYDNHAALIPNVLGLGSRVIVQ